jgi:putative tricarboxylic transport membrane protein
MRHTTGNATGRWRNWRAMVALSTVLLLLAACSAGAGSGETSTTQASTTETTSTTAPMSESTTTTEAVEPRVLEPLASGYPNRPITLWSTQGAGQYEDLLNNWAAQIANRYSPVPVTTQTTEQGAAIQYGLIDYLHTLEGSDEGYDVFGFSVFGSGLRPYTNAAAAGRDYHEIVPIIGSEYTPAVIAVAPDSEYQTIEDLLAAASEKELVSVGGATGSAPHADLIQLEDAAGVTFRFLPTNDSNESRQTLIGGGADLGAFPYQAGLGDQVRILAYTGDEDVPANFPQAPTLGSLGYEVLGGNMRAWGVTTDVSEEARAWLYELFSRVLADPDFQGFLDAQVHNYTADEVSAERDRVVGALVAILDDLGMLVTTPNS